MATADARGNGIRIGSVHGAFAIGDHNIGARSPPSGATRRYAAERHDDAGSGGDQHHGDERDRAAAGPVPNQPADGVTLAAGRRRRPHSLPAPGMRPAAKPPSSPPASSVP
ncbi:hypothetical protein [Streptomyces sp. NPDC059080]|uniref:hypothetical protein n=1 Tax=Streptomyces sp. NPDC059080 TaxID=3346718 RepID=UPI003690C940